ncbi:MAG: hypothetical protein K0S30_220 [Clostridia bacterium]|jgi:hypothetical protein|nr:hypothetical protein [Clostridia bacterium]
MEKTILISISPYVQKYYLNENYEDLPKDIKEEIIAKLSVVAEKTDCIISVGFDEKGEIFIEERHDDPIGHDDIGVALEIKRLQTEEVELLKALKLWHMIYRTQHGKIVREIVIQQAKKSAHEQILKSIEKKYGVEGRDFAKALLEE